MAALNVLIATPMVMPAIVVAAAIAAIASVVNAYNQMQSAIDGAKKSQNDFLTAFKQVDSRMMEIINDGAAVGPGGRRAPCQSAKTA